MATRKGRSKTARLAALNVTMHSPHSPERYVELLQDAYESLLQVEMGELHVCMLGQLDKPIEDKLDAPIAGEIFRFVSIDPSDPWFNTQTNKPAADEEVKKINIPSYLLPHLHRIPFVFFPKKHKLVFVTYLAGMRAKGKKPITMGHGVAHKLFTTLFTQKDLLAKYKQVNVTVIPDSGLVEEILNMKQLSKLSILLTRPNPDDGDALSEHLKNGLESQKAKQLELNFTAESGSGLEPNEETKGVAKAAAINGRVIGYGKNANGKTIEKSTQERAKIVPLEFNASLHNLTDLLKTVLSKFTKK